MVHIFTAGKKRLPKRSQGRFFWAWCCDKKRIGRNLLRQEFYDSCRHWCKPGTGCKVAG